MINLKACFSFIGLVALIGFPITCVSADGYREHGRHVHGIAHLNIAVEDSQLLIEFTSPAANIVGFEHHPRSSGEKEEIKQAIKRLKAGEKIFRTPDTSTCQLVQSGIETNILEEDDNHADHHHNGHDHHSEFHHKNGHHTHDDHDHDEDHHDHAHHDDHEHAHGQHHADFTAEYQFKCRKSHPPKRINIQLFKLFPGIEEIKAQIITEQKQISVELSASDHTIIF